VLELPDRLYSPHSVAAEEAKRLDSTGAVKRCCRNDLYTSTDSSHDAPYTSREYGQAVFETGPTIDMGSVKAQGSKAKPVNGSEPPRATRARDQTTQRVATSSHIRSPIEGTQCSQASYLSLDQEISFTPLCGLASNRSGFLRGLPGEEA
jgi:hypothetical protein